MMELYKYEGNIIIEPLTKIVAVKASCNSKSASLKFLVLSDHNSEIEVYKLDANESRINSFLVGTDVSQEGFKKIGTISLKSEEGLQACAFEFRVTGESFVIALSSSSKFSVLNPMLEESDGQILQDEEPTTPEPTEQEILQAEMLLNQQQIISKQTEIDMTLAELLLNQQGVGR